MKKTITYELTEKEAARLLLKGLACEGHNPTLSYQKGQQDGIHWSAAIITLRYDVEEATDSQ